MLSRSNLKNLLKKWNQAWDRHDLDGVMQLFHEDVLFDNWTGARARGRDNLERPGLPGSKTTAVSVLPEKTPL